MPTHTFTHSWSDGQGQTLTGSTQVSEEENLYVDEPLAAAVANQLMNVNFLAARVKGLYMICDQACVLKTNSTSAPGDTINLAAGVPYVYSGTGTAPFSTDVTALYATNSSSTLAATLRIRMLLDPTVAV